MLFNSFTYLLFLPLVVLLYWTIPSRFRSWLLLIASYVFYMNWIPVYGLLIVGLTIVNYCLGLAISRFSRARKQILTLGLVFNIGSLCWFKYANFLIDSLWQSIHWLGQIGATQQSLPAPVLNILLPLGISFFTFEFIHYITDVYKGSPPIQNFKDFALFAAFFPSQIAGPIKRFQDFSKQMEHSVSFNESYFRTGIFLILQGLYKKIVLGDNLGTLINYGFTHTTELGTIDAWLAAAGFTFQIFFDFSGYTDIGRGSALLLGYKVPENFNWPFIAANLTDFWRRWHMSLSTWLRDYLFIPMGGSRGTPWAVRRNIFLTMVLGGLWHGAAWHYVIWGAFHGLGLVASKEWHDFVSRFEHLSKLRETKWWHYSGVGLTLIFLFIAGILFRAEQLSDVGTIMERMCSLTKSSELTRLFWQSTVPISLLGYIVFLFFRTKSGPFTESVNKLRQWWDTSLSFRLVTCTSVALIILGFAPGKIAPFIYFQF